MWVLRLADSLLGSCPPDGRCPHCALVSGETVQHRPPGPLVGGQRLAGGSGLGRFCLEGPLGLNGQPQGRRGPGCTPNSSTCGGDRAQPTGVLQPFPLPVHPHDRPRAGGPNTGQASAVGSQPSPPPTPPPPGSGFSLPAPRVRASVPFVPSPCRAVPPLSLMPVQDACRSEEPASPCRRALGPPCGPRVGRPSPALCEHRIGPGWGSSGAHLRVRHHVQSSRVGTGGRAAGPGLGEHHQSWSP